ncbi:MAG: hypothetical protein PHN93_09165 [Sphaerochaetaceae bacterium]|nr:hypothetical protein [Sphaerochaetaceae bacterium]
MKKVFLVLALVLIIALPVSAAGYMKTNGVGAGITLGYPTGLTVRYGMDDFRLLGNLTWDFGSGFSLDVGALYDITDVKLGDFPIYINGGALAGVGLYSNDFLLSVNGIVGASYYLEDYPVEIFLNLAPGANIIKPAGASIFSFKGGLGGVWYFE